jgi:hypothetical protein
VKNIEVKNNKMIRLIGLVVKVNSNRDMADGVDYLARILSVIVCDYAEQHDHTESSYQYRVWGCSKDLTALFLLQSLLLFQHVPVNERINRERTLSNHFVSIWDRKRVRWTVTESNERIGQ